MKNLVLRSASGIVYVGAIVGAVLAGGVWLALLLCVLSTVGIYELIAMTSEGKYPRIATLIDIAAGIVMILSSWYTFIGGNPQTGAAMAAAWLCLIIVRLIGQLYAAHVNPVNSISRSLMSQIYIALPLALVPVLYAVTSPYILLAIFIFIWVNDTGAFCAGCTLGRHKLFERISPKKTWEGFFGGMLACIAAAFVMRGCFEDYYGMLTYAQMWKLGMIVSIFATFGDLFESLIKRTSGVKDSGNIIPGHGGILDRIDSLLVVIPVATIYFFLL